jgi:hypothetical protein
MRKRGAHFAEKLEGRSALEEDVSIHIFTTSATMVGVCLTVIGLFRLMLQLKSVGTLADDFLCIDSMLFLVSCGLAYWALRTRNTKRRHRTEKIADVLFLLALSLMTGICALITYTVV